MAQGELVRVVAYLEAGLAERLAAAAASDDRSVSKEIARRLEASFQPAARVLPETPKPYDEEKRAVMVEKLQQQVPGVKTASVAFPSVPQDLAGPVRPRPRASG